ncbi:PREDICTED: olfactory receptor 2AT4-like [Chinchilla lanigera]|uniref:olfactory receptor 2AT4-like n=1 Tax=Chinchilla lanigera TaxID=34839 RepID=UPI00038F0FBE|nr:PREDICTED: olfactory receptor 2AT4-like [Chinchilla lanigera]
MGEILLGKGEAGGVELYKVFIVLEAVVSESSLQKLIYFFLINLSALDILFIIITVPKMLPLFFHGGRFSASLLASTDVLVPICPALEAFILVVMACDHHVAICHPLHYWVHMTPQTHAALAGSAWLTTLLLHITEVVKTSQMASDDIAYIYHGLCDHLTLVQASCSDTRPQTLMGFCISTVVSFFLLALLSYVQILVSVLHVSFQERCSKAFSTHTSHSLVVDTCYSLIAVAIVASRADLLRLAFAILTAVLNSVIYTLRNKMSKWS